MKPRKTAITIVVFVGICLIGGPRCASADMFGGSDSVIILKLTTIYNALKNYYDQAMELVQEAKTQSDNLKKLSDLAKDTKKEYDFVTNFSFQRELDKIKGDIEGLTNLDNLDGKSTEQIVQLLTNEIDRRFRYGTPEERQRASELKSQLSDIERLNEIKKAKTNEAVEMGSNKQSQANYMASISSSCALMSSLELAQAQRRLEEEMVREDQKGRDQDLLKEFNDSLDEMK